MKKSFKLNPAIISIFFILIGLIAYGIRVPFLDVVELKTIDLRFQSRGHIVPLPEVVLAVIDEKSIAREGKWIWPRSKMADLVNKLSKAGARVVAFDIGFLEPDDRIVVQVIDKIKKELTNRQIQNREIDKYLKNLKRQTDNDARLAEAIKNSSAKIVLGYFFQMEPSAADHIIEAELGMHQENIKGSAYKFVRYRSNAAQGVELFDAFVPQSNIKEIASSTPYSGFFNMRPDQDGSIRWAPGLYRFKDMLYAPLSLSSVSAYLDSPLSVRIAEFGVEAIQIGDIVIPTDERGQIFINYRGKAKTFPHIPVTDILIGSAPAELIKDKIVLVGATAVGIYDLRVTPFSGVFPGLEIHANVVDSILSRDFLWRPDWAAMFDIIAIIISGLLLWLALPRAGVIPGFMISCFLFIGYILLCQFLFSYKGLILNMVYPSTVIMLIYGGITIHKYVVESSQKRFIKDAFSTYLAPAVVKQLIDSPEKLVLGGEQRDITAFFSDIEGFTSISEKLAAPELVELLNEFLTEMTDIILKFEGTLDKFEGDAIIAFFGAPNDIENHAATACRACVEMQKRLVELRLKWKSEGKPELMMRIGLCTGPAVVGNMGSRNRMDYTMMGDTVNTAARLEGVNKIYGIFTLISGTTYHAAGDGIVAREIDSINVIGKKEPVNIYQLLGYNGDCDEPMAEMLNVYHHGLQAYRNQDWDRAIQFFNDVLKNAPDDGPSVTMLKRCNALKQNPPGKNWNGTFTMEIK